ncbi:integrase [Salinibacterium sp. ZJ450]|uniref:integrase n=1 Tax=Salinibacterium sp. ZJ450 TaxID=2708338 RepID=UPI001420CC64|nr:integrase [Salinibacterium sp. ZJ450]
MHAPTLLRLLQHVRNRQNAKVDLSATKREDLVDYKDIRRPRLAAGSWNNELAILSSFFDYALKAGWVDQNPVPRWGSRQRSTLADRTSTHRRERHLTEQQLRFFLEVGLRGDLPSDRDTRPPYPERDYILGLLLATTGLRRQEAVLVLDCEIPTPTTMPASGVHTFTRYGKGSRPRDIWITDTFVDKAQLYRSSNREKIIARAQSSLRKRVREHRALMTVVEQDNREPPKLIIDGHRVKPELLSNADRARAVTRRADGTIEPLAFIVAEGGKPPALRTVNQWFNDAVNRVSPLDHPAQPPSHIHVTPHVMRHTFAVRMLAALIRLGRETKSNPYHFLASPEFVVQQLLGHADIETTAIYLRAALRYSDELPDALRMLVAESIGSPGGSAFAESDTYS